MGTRLASAIIVQISEREQLNHSPGPRALEKEMEGPDEDAVENGLAVLEIQCMSGTAQCMSHAINLLENAETSLPQTQC